MRKYYIDYLRVLAILAVITIHVTSYYYAKFDTIRMTDWWLANILNAASRLAVPLFVMISGAVLLEKRYGVLDFYKKRAIRLLPAIVFWNLFYIIFKFLTKGKGFHISHALIDLLIDGKSYYHLWYLSMFACLMLFAPFVNKIVQGSRLTKDELQIFCLICFIFFLLKGTSALLKNLACLRMEWFTIFPWFIAYYIAGHLIDKYDKMLRISKFANAIFLIILIALGSAANFYYAYYAGKARDFLFLNSVSPVIFLTTILTFQLAKRNSELLMYNRYIIAISESSFGIYLIHPVFLYFLRKFLPFYDAHGIIYIPLSILATFLLSFVSITTLRKFSLFRFIS